MWITKDYKVGIIFILLVTTITSSQQYKSCIKVIYFHIPSSPIRIIFPLLNFHGRILAFI